MKRRGFLASLASLIPTCLLAKEAKLESLHPLEELGPPSPDNPLALGIRDEIRSINGIAPDVEGEVILLPNKNGDVFNIDGMEPQSGFKLLIHEKNPRDNGIYQYVRPHYFSGEGNPNGKRFLNLQEGDKYFNTLDDTLWLYIRGIWVVVAVSYEA